LFPIVAIVAGVLAGQSSASRPTVLTPCKLASSGQVKAAFGGKIGAGKLESTIPGAPTCEFAVKGSNLGMNGSAIVFITPGQSRATFALAKTLVPGAVTVSGVGDGAFYNPRTTTVELIKGTTVANAQAVFLNPGGPAVSAAKVEADAILLAKAVAKHL
jgi:hypothetical protein